MTVRAVIALLLALCGPAAALCPRGAAPAATLYSADLRGLAIEEQLFFSSLQGITAQKQPRIYYLRDNGPSDSEWAAYYREKGYIRQLIPLEPWELAARFRGELKGAAVWDPGLTSTVNAACAAAGAEALAVCTPELADRLNIPVKLDLRGRFSTDREVYEWMWKKYGGSFSRQALCSLEPMAAGAWLRDYTIQHRIFTFWVRSGSCGIPGGRPGDEDAMQTIMARFPSNIPVLGFWQAGDADEGLTEYGGLIFAGRTGKYTVVSDWTPNLSVHSGIRARGPFRQSPPRRLKYDPAKKYVMVTQYESGDCPWYWLRLQKANWLQKERGSFPMNWCLGPRTAELMPGVLEWFYANSAGSDCFFCAMSGAGYTMPRYFAPEDPGARRAFLRDTVRDMKRLDLSVISLHTDHWYSEPEPAEAYGEYAELKGVKAVLADFGRNETLPPERYAELCGSVPLFHTQNRWDMHETPETLTRDILGAKGQFISVMALSWTLDPAKIYKALSALPPEYLIVRCDEMADLFLQRQGER